MVSENTLEKLGRGAKQAASELRLVSSEQKDHALANVRKVLQARTERIIEENNKDLAFAREKKISEAMLDRLLINNERLKSITNSLEEIISLPDPVGQQITEISRPNGLLIKRVRTPLGVVGVIFESRPNVTIDAGALCLKSGNATILRCGSESLYTCQILASCFAEGVVTAGLPKHAVQLVSTRDRSAVIDMLKMTEYIDVIVPRGGKNLVSVVQTEAKVPVFAHLEGIVHIFIDRDANPQKAVDIVLNSKTRRPGICGAVECLLIDNEFLKRHGAELIDKLLDLGVDVRVDLSLKHIKGTVLADDSDWGKEYLAMSLAVKKVADLNDAIKHIEKFGSNHTDCIVTENDDVANEFFMRLDSAILMRNASTQFADGGEFGLGAEIGIATGKIHARGPVGLEQLTTFKYLVSGDGQVRA